MPERISTFIWAAVFTLLIASSAVGCKRIKSLDDKISRVEITESKIDFALGGGTMLEAVHELRYRHGLAVSFEEAVKEKKETVSLQAALKQLEELRIAGHLGEADKKRQAAWISEAETLERLQKLRKKKPLSPSEADFVERYNQFYGTADSAKERILGEKKTAIRVVGHNVTIESILNRLTELDSDYVWTNHGTRDKPLLEIHPKNTKRESTLNWIVPSLCEGEEKNKARKIRPVQTLFSSGEHLFEAFQANGIQVLLTNASASGGRAKLAHMPRIEIDLCRDNLTAHDLLTEILRQMGSRYFWSVQSLEGKRTLFFDYQ